MYLLCKTLGRKVAVKILNDLSAGRIEFAEIVATQIASALIHPNILVIHEIGETDGTHYIVSEFVKGKTLREVCNEKTLPLPEVLGISIEIANALCSAHEAHLVHRDIKPENIMIRPDGLVKVLDFGLAKLSAKHASLLGPKNQPSGIIRRQKACFGNVHYMSPNSEGEGV